MSLFDLVAVAALVFAVDAWRRQWRYEHRKFTFTFDPEATRERLKNLPRLKAECWEWPTSEPDSAA